MNLDNFIVRPNRRSVEKFAAKAAWKSISEKEIEELHDKISGQTYPGPELQKLKDRLMGTFAN